MTDAIKLAIDALEAVTMDAVSVGAGENAISDIARTKAEAALAALRAQPAGWIDASKKMPPPQVRVLGLDPQHNIVEVDMWFGPDFQWGYSHWMPLPPPPGQERAQPDHIVDASGMVDRSELVKRLRLEADHAEKEYYGDNVELMREAANALESKAIGETK